MSDLKETLNNRWQQLTQYPNVLNAAVGTKLVAGKDTGIPAIVVYVSRKLDEVELAEDNIIPKQIDGLLTDVIELAPKTWTAGKTSISQLPPEEQLKRLGAHTLTKEDHKRAIMAFPSSGQSDWTCYANPIQDQYNCGSCVPFDVTGVWETLINIISGELVKLSEQHLFFCGGGKCEYGSIVENILNQAMKGVCLESCLPYSPTNSTCKQGICDKWWLEAKKLASWSAVSDPTQILNILDAGPLVATMTVPQSFLNYTGGIYNRLANDPPVGRHGVGTFGYSLDCYKIIRNSWGLDWGQNCVINGIARPGWCTIDPKLLDNVMYLIWPDGQVPEPSPEPSPCKAGARASMVLNAFQQVFGRKGRFYYMNPGK